MDENVATTKYSVNPTLLFFGFAVLMVIGLGVFAAIVLNPNSNTTSNSSTDTKAQVMEKDGRQFVTVNAKNGFSPRSIDLKANQPVTLNVITKDTYDCTNYVVIPSLKISKSLPITGETPVEIPAQAPGTKITATCGMGHYPLTLNFIGS